MTWENCGNFVKRIVWKKCVKKKCEKNVENNNMGKLWKICEKNNVEKYLGKNSMGKSVEKL